MITAIPVMLLSWWIYS